MGAVAVVDHNMKFMYGFIGYPGSLHDQRALNNCALGQALRACPSDYFPKAFYHLIGDSAFAIKHNMMTPYRDCGNLTRQQLRYNKKQSQTRQLVEYAFGLLKEKFRVLQYLEVELHRAPRILETCMLLHNFILINVLEEQPRHEHETLQIPVGMTPAGKRDHISSLM